VTWSDRGRSALLRWPAAATIAGLVLCGCAGSTSQPPKTATNPPARTTGGRGPVAGSSSAPVAPVARSPAATTTPSASTQHPNIVLVLTDDLSLNLLPYMPQVQALATRGLTFDDYFVSDSICCPSRASIFTGNFPHDTGVFDNVPSGGGFETFYRRGEQQTSFNVVLQHAGYMTAMMGKYLNGYLEAGQDSAPIAYVPPGWNEWDVAGFGYPEFDYALNGARHPATGATLR
jgi:N-acetylglucosamine-6-sulfatase